MLDFIIGLAQVAFLMVGIMLALYAFLLSGLFGSAWIADLFEKKEKK